MSALVVITEATQPTEESKADYIILINYIGIPFENQFCGPGSVQFLSFGPPPVRLCNLIILPSGKLRRR